MSRRPPPMPWKTVWPLALFLVAFGAFWIGVQAADWMIFTRPRSLWLLCTTPWFWWLHQRGRHGLRGVRSVMALWCRLALVGLFVLLLAEPRVVRKNDQVATVFAVDVSDSISEAIREGALSFVVNTVQEKPSQDLAGLIVFGRNAAVELPPRVSFPFETINALVERDGTSLERGLTLAGAMLPDDCAGRVVLISDGTQTEGNVTDALKQLQSRGISVDVLPIDYVHEREVWVERLDLPARIKVGDAMEASLVVSSLQDGTGILKLRENGQEIQRQEVSYQAGKTRLVLPLHFREAGRYEYEVVLEPPPGQDGWEGNNRAINSVELKGRGKILVVISPDDNQRDYQRLADAMTAAGMLVEFKQAYEMPYDAPSLNPYDAILFVNLAADACSPPQRQAIRDAVYYQGVGFLMVGGENSFGPGGYHRTRIEELLPVQMDVKQRKILPKGALAIVLHTCEFAEGNTWAKRITKQAIRVLGAQDEAGVLIYGYGNGVSGEQWLFPLTEVSEYETMVPLINQAQIGDMPSFATTMELGLAGLKQSDAAIKHMIIISDGDPSPPTPELVGRYVENKISISTVLINPHGNQEVKLMSALARHTGGRYYYPKNPARLPSIFLKEAKTLKRSMIQNKTFTPRLGLPSPVLKGVDELPPLHGYVITTPKPRAQLLLEYDTEAGADPVLALWRFGLGTTAAFTSDLSPNWGREWVSWDRYRPVIKQLLTAIARVKNPSHLNLRCRADGVTGVVEVEDQFPDASFLAMRAQVVGPDGTPRSFDLQQVAARQYEATFPLEGAGRYQVVVAGEEGSRIETAVGAFAVPYSAEYLRFRSNPALLQKIADQTGGRLLSGAESGAELFEPIREPRSSSRPIAPSLLWLLAILIPLDVAIRRVQLDAQVIRRWFSRKVERTTTGTMGALLRAKQDVASRIQTADGTRPPLIIEPKRTESDEEAAAKPTPPKDEPAPDRATTTGQLLAKKRKWKKEDPS